MTPKPKISVLMPAYNAEAYIAEAIESILSQTYTDFECIIIDDGSSDSTWEIIQEYASKDSRIQAHQNEVNLRICKTRNRLLSYAKGQYIAWMDADDISVADRLEKQMNYLDLNTDVGIVGGYIEFFDNISGKKTLRTYFEDDRRLRKLIFRQSPVSQGTAMVRKNIMDEIGNFDESLEQAEDLDVSFRIGEVSHFANIQSVVLKCRVHGESISNASLKKNIEDTLIVRGRYKNSERYEYGIYDSFASLIANIIKFLPSKLVLFLFNFSRNG